MPHNDTVSDFIQKLGNFYEVVEIRDDGSEVTPIKQAKDPNGDVPFNNNTSDGELLSTLVTALEQGEELHILEQLEEMHTYSLPVKAIKQASSPNPHNGHSGVNGANGHGLSNGGQSEEETDSEVEEEFCDTSDLQPHAVESRSKLNGTSDSDHSEMDVPLLIHSDNGHERQAQEPPQDLLPGPVLTRGGGESGSDGSHHGNTARHRERTTSNSSQHGRGSARGSRPPSEQGGERGHGGGSGSGGRPPPWYPPPVTRPDVSEHIAVALVRLQQDMTSVLNRLNTLEALQLAQTQHQVSRSRTDSENSRKGQITQPWWWPFPGVSTPTVAFIVAWPFMVHFIFKLISAHRNRFRRR